MAIMLIAVAICGLGIYASCAAVLKGMKLLGQEDEEAIGKSKVYGIAYLLFGAISFLIWFMFLIVALIPPW